MGATFSEIIVNIDIMTTTPASVSGFNISAFLSSVASKGLAKSNKFQCYFMMPQGFTSYVTAGLGNDSTNIQQYARGFSAWCSKATLPHIRWEQMEGIQRYGLGPTEPAIGFPSFNPLQITIIADAQGETRAVFEQWMALVGDYNFQNPVALYPSPAGTYSPGVVGYPDDYITQFYVSTFDDAGNEITRHIFDRAFPVELAPVQLSWEEAAEVMTFDVTIKSAFWYQTMNNTLGL
jgi:hypothetical protein